MCAGSATAVRAQFLRKEQDFSVVYWIWVSGTEIGLKKDGF